MDIICRQGKGDYPITVEVCGQVVKCINTMLVVFEHVIPCIINMDIISSTVDKVLM